MNKITILGTSDRLKEITNNDYTKVVLRTEISKAYEMLKSRGVDFETLDYVYDKADDFDKLDTMLASEVIKIVKTSDVIYVVPESAIAGDGSVKAIAQNYDNVEIIAGDAPEYDMLSVLTDADVSNGYTVIPAACLESGMFSSRLPLAITALDNEFLLSDVKLLLTQEYSDEHFVYIGKGKDFKKMSLFEIDRFKNPDHNTMIYVPQKTISSRYDLFELEGVFEKLRSPNGCPWDREQTHVSLKRYLLEECAEVLDAIDKGAMHELVDELGDVLLQVLFHATIASERGDFEMRDVIDNLVRKLIKRHPHVFGDSQADSSEEVLKQWDEIKHEEKEDKSISAKLKSVPKSMTALMRAQKVLSRAAKTELFTKEDNDFYFVVKSIESHLAGIKDKKNVSENLMGELLFDMANLSRILKVESELALHDVTKQYIQKFHTREFKEKN